MSESSFLDRWNIPRMGFAGFVVLEKAHLSRANLPSLIDSIWHKALTSLVEILESGRKKKGKHPV